MTTIDMTPSATRRGSYDKPATFAVGIDRQGESYGASPLADLGSVLTEYFGRRVGFVGDPWSQLAEGFLVRTHVYGPDCHAVLTPADFGLDESGFGELTKFMKAGSIDLMESGVRKTLQSVSTRFRALPKRFGVQLHWGRFVPLTAFAEMDAEAQVLTAEWNEALDLWVNNYVACRTEAEIRARKLAEQAWFVANKLGGEILSREEWATLSGFVDFAAARMMQDYPAEDKIKALYRLSYDQDVIPMPSLVEAQASWVAQVQQDQAARIELAKLQLKNDKTIKEAEYLDAWNKLSLVEQKAKAKAELVEKYADKTRRELESRKREIIGTFYAGFALQLRMRLYQSLALVIEGVKTGKITPQSSGGLRGEVEAIAAIRLDNDEEIDQMLATCRRLLGSPDGSSFTTAKVSTAIEDLGMVLQLSILALGGNPRAKRDLKADIDVLRDLGKDGDEAFRTEIRRRRANIGLDESLGEIIMDHQGLGVADLRARRNRLAAALD